MSAAFRLLILLLFLSLTLGVVWVIWEGEGARLANNEISQGKEELSTPLRLKGFSYTSVEGGVLRSRLRADLLVVLPRRLGGFQMRGANDLTLFNVDLETFFSDDAKEGELLSGKAMQGQLSTLQGVKGLGRIGRVVMKPFHAKLHVAQVARSEIQAEGADVDFSRHATRFDKATLCEVGGVRCIDAGRILWDEANKRFSIPGDFLARTPTRQGAGKGLYVYPDFRLEPMPQENSETP